eukprot:scaffold25162_cov22-Tisochrysis_lutea.AAC.1
MQLVTWISGGAAAFLKERTKETVRIQVMVIRGSIPRSNQNLWRPYSTPAPILRQKDFFFGEQKQACAQKFKDSRQKGKHDRNI